MLELDLHRKIATSGIPIVGVGRDRIDYAVTATPEQRQQGDAILAAFDWDAEPVPDECSPLQAALALDRRGYLDNVEQVIEAFGREAVLAWTKATVIRRKSPLLQAIAASIPGLEEDLEDILREAVLIEV